MNAELGADRSTVIPQPLYSPRTPCCFHNDDPSLQNVLVDALFSTEEVCIRDFMVSAGKKRKL